MQKFMLALDPARASCAVEHPISYFRSVSPGLVVASLWRSP